MFRSIAKAIASLAVCLTLAAPVAAQCVSLTTPGSAYTQSFNTLSNTAGSTTNNLTITGWFLTETGGGARDNEQYAVDTGGSNTGDTFSYGAAGNTDRALGGLQSGTLIPVIGACFTNNTGATITTLDVAYTGEQWRIGNTAAARDDRLDFQYSLNATDLATGTWTDVNALDFTNPVKTAGTAGALDGNAAANRTAISNAIPSLAIANGATFWIRWNDLNASGADDGLSLDDFSLTAQAGVVVPGLSVDNVTLAEGNAGTTSFTFTVSLSAPAGPGGVTFDIATADNTATTAGNDYVANSLTGQTIPAGSSTYNFSVTVNGDTTAEANETFFVNVTNVTGANVTDGQGTGTINNDDVSLTPIHDIQGPGASSPIVGATVTTRGIVTGRRSNGFFIQEPDATVDADPATSEGLLVFTSSLPPAAAAVGALVQVTGTVTEFVPSQDPLQPPVTELTSPTTVQVSTGNPLPAAIPLSASFPDPAGPVDQLERLEGMRVSVASLTVVAPTGGFTSEANATGSSDGVFFGVVTGVPRPFREPGIQAPDPAPAGTIPPIPRWDANPEVIRVDSDAIGGAPVDATTGAVVTGLVGPLDYGFRHYTILRDAAAGVALSGFASLRPVAVATAREFTVASYNLERFYDTVDDVGSDVALTAAAFDLRLNKASRGIRDYLRMPDILGVVEVENLTTLQALAARISADALAASQPDPQYDAYLVEGNGTDLIDVGFLVKTAPVAAATPRVEVVSVTQELDGSLFVNPDSSTEILHDRPPLRLNAIVHHQNGATYPLTVIVNHLRSLNDVDSPDAGPSGWPTLGARVRAKRQAQAEDLANLVQARQTADPAERIILVGDFNAFEFNDGLGDSIGTIKGTPVPDNETAVPGDGVDLVNPDLTVLLDALAAERYSFTFSGNAQSLDHVLVNQALINDSAQRRVEHARINADFYEALRGDAAFPARLSDHDPVVAFFEVTAFGSADLTLTQTDAPDPVAAGSNVTYTITITNNGPDAADNVTFSDTLPAVSTFTSLTAPGGWSCTTPAVGAYGNITCTIASLPAGTSVFTLVVTIDPSGPAGDTSNAATVSSTTADPASGNESEMETTTVVMSSDLQITKSDAPDPVTAGTNITYTINITNAGPSNAGLVELNDVLPAGLTFVSVTPQAGWTCVTPADRGPSDPPLVYCSAPMNAGATATFTIVAQVSPAATGVVSNTATATAAGGTPDPNSANNSATTTTTVVTSADMQVTKSASPDPVAVGANLTYTVTVANAGPSNAATVTLADTLPANTTFVSLTSPAGWSCTTPAVGAAGTINCSAATMATTNAVFTLVVQVGSGAASTLSNTATVSAATADPDSTNNSATASVTVLDASRYTVSKSVSGTLISGGTAVYSIVLTNTAGFTMADNPGNEFVDVLPAGVSFISVNATSGTAAQSAGTVTWNGSLPSGGSVTITITVQVSASAGTVVSNQGSANVDLDGNGTNETTIASNDPATGAAGDATTFTVGAATGAVTGTKTVAGNFVPNGTVTYTIVLTNSMQLAQADNAGAEFTDVLPAGLQFVSANATSGTAAAAGNTVTWNGALPVGGSVTITIVAAIAPDATGTISNQGTIAFDTDNNGSNDGAGVTDNPATTAPADPTSFALAALAVIPTLTETMMLLLVAMLSGIALIRMKS